jgi:hypothetical protein
VTIWSLNVEYHSYESASDDAFASRDSSAVLCIQRRKALVHGGVWASCIFVESWRAATTHGSAAEGATGVRTAGYVASLAHRVGSDTLRVRLGDTVAFGTAWLRGEYASMLGPMDDAAVVSARILGGLE